MRFAGKGAPVRRYGACVAAIVALCNVAAMVFDDSVSEALEHLSEREQDIVRLRFGLDDGEAWTRDELAEKYGVTGERIRQIEAKALAKLRRVDGHHLPAGNLEES